VPAASLTAVRLSLVFASLALSLVACSPGAPPAPPQKPPPAAPPRPPTPASAPSPAAPAGVQAVNGAAFTPGPAAPASAQTPDPVLIRAEVLLDRAGFSPGVIDGLAGSNARKAIAAFQEQQNLPTSGQIDAQTWSLLTRDGRPVLQAYTITPADIAGPFAPNVGEDFVKLAALPDGPLYSSPLQALAERFHMSQGLVQALNANANLSSAGTVIWLAAPGAPAFAKGDVRHIVVSKAKDQVFAYGDQGRLLAVYPATVGSTERPSPRGHHKVKGVGWNPQYVYDPAKLKWGPRSHGKFVIKPGPEGPVGAVWIDIDAPSYGIHGSPDPTLIGKTASHGCVRLTNWDAVALAHGVKPGVPVDFVS
jgi:lipoprotein-anchoring transpeptidase ErfK/SrfK